MNGKSIHWERILVPAISIVMGIYLLLHPWKATNTLCSLLGWLVLLAGVGAVLDAVLVQRGSGLFVPMLAIGLIAAIAGVYLATRPWLLVGFVNLVICMLLLIEGGINLRNASIRKALGDGWWWIPLVVGVVCIVLGLCAMFSPWATNFLMRLVGLLLVCGGASNLIVAFLV